MTLKVQTTSQQLKMEKCKTCTRYVNGYCALTMAKPNGDKCDYRRKYITWNDEKPLKLLK